MATGGKPAETWLTMEQIEDREDSAGWRSQDLPRRNSTGGRIDIEVEASSVEKGCTSEARPLLENRDPKAVNKCLKVTFEDVLAEPPSVRSFDTVWLWSHALFEVTRLWCYRLISLLCAVPLLLAAGTLFALLSCLHIWLIMPCVQLCLINMQWVQMVWGNVLNIAIGPFFTSIGKCCGGITIRLARD